MRAFAACLTAASCLLLAGAADAGRLTVRNTSGGEITCSFDGFTQATGWSSDLTFTVPAGASLSVPSNAFGTTGMLNWAQCAGLRAENLRLTATSSDRTLIFNGQAKRVLNVLLYPYAPSNPPGNFGALTASLAQMFQSRSPDILVNLVEDAAVDDIYYDGKLQALFQEGGYDLVEIDTISLSDLTGTGLVMPLEKVNLSAFHPAAQAAVMVGNQIYGIPSWICMDFLYSFDQALVKAAGSATGLYGYLQETSGRLVTNYNGTWRLIGLYLNAVAAAGGDVNAAITAPVQASLLDGLVPLMQTCEADGKNPCIDKTFRNAPPGALARMFVQSQLAALGDFSETSLYLRLLMQAKAPAIGAFPFGPKLAPMVYTDAYAVNAARCNGKACAEDALAFTAFMNEPEVRLQIAFSADLPESTPPRYLLPALKDFYSLPKVTEDPLYSQFIGIVAAAQPFPNSINAQKKAPLHDALCKTMKEKLPTYDCKMLGSIGEAEPAAPWRYYH